VKDYAGKIASKVVKGQLGDLLRISSPSFIHSPLTYLQGAAMDLSLSSRYLTKAALTNDPFERLRLILAMYIGGSNINPAFC
jgi:hypothetical protein